MMQAASDVSIVLAARFRSAARMLGLSVAAVGLLVLIGWAFAIPVLTSVMPGLATMKPNTALGFILAGSSLALAGRGGSQRRRGSQIALACLAGLLGLLTFAEYLFTVDLGIDNRLFPLPDTPDSGPPVARMAPATAVAFTLSGIALALVQTPGSRFIGALAATFSGSIGLLAVLGYILNVETLYGVAPYSSVALHTAIALMALNSGILFARPESGVMIALTSQTLGGHAARTLIPYALFAPLVIAVLRWRAEEADWFGTSFGIALTSLVYIAESPAVSPPRPRDHPAPGADASATRLAPRDWS